MAIGKKSHLSFSSHGIRFSLTKQAAYRKLLVAVIEKEKKKAGNICYTFCNDRLLLSLNKKFLNHSTLTDIITFQYPCAQLSGEIYISISRIKENAKKYNVSFENELFRVMIHGLLHLCGYKDKTTADRKQMRKKEDYYLRTLKIR